MIPELNVINEEKNDSRIKSFYTNGGSRKKILSMILELSIRFFFETWIPASSKMHAQDASAVVSIPEGATIRSTQEGYKAGQKPMRGQASLHPRESVPLVLIIFGDYM